MDPDSDPGGPKTYGSDGSGSGSATLALALYYYFYGAGGVRGEADRVPEGAGVLGAQAGGAGHTPRHQADPHASHPPLQGISVVDVDVFFLDSGLFLNPDPNSGQRFCDKN